MRKSIHVMFMVLVVLSALALPQTPDTPDTEQDSRISPPAPLAGSADSLHPRSPVMGTNAIVGSVAFSSIYTDNAQLTSTGRVSDVSYRVEPGLSVQHVTTRVLFDVSGSLGVVANQHLRDRNQLSANVSADGSYRISEFTTVRLSDTFLNTSGLFADNEPRVGDGIGVLQRPNSSLFTYAHVMSNSILADLSHQVGPNTIVGLRGSQSMSWYPGSAQDPGLATLYDSRSVGAEAFYNRRLSPRHWGGLTLRARRFVVGGSLGQTNAASALFFYAFSATPATTISFFGGPEFSNTSLPSSGTNTANMFARRVWSPAAGMMFSWLGARTSATATFARQVSDGGGLTSAVTLYSADAGIRREFGRQSLEVNFGFSQNTPLVPTESTQLFSGRARVSRRFGNNYLMQLAYGHDHHGSAQGHRLADSNQVSFSILYTFSRGGANR